MCIDYLGKPQRTRSRITGYKIVRPLARRIYESGLRPHERRLQDGFDRQGQSLLYASGKITKAPPHSPGIYVFLRRPRAWDVREGQRLIRVAIPRGRMVRYGKQGTKRALTADRVRVLNVLPARP